jgi:hypothetical protein
LASLLAPGSWDTGPSVPAPSATDLTLDSICIQVNETHGPIQCWASGQQCLVSTVSTPQLVRLGRGVVVLQSEVEVRIWNCQQSDVSVPDAVGFDWFEHHHRCMHPDSGPRTLPDALQVGFSSNQKHFRMSSRTIIVIKITQCRTVGSFGASQGRKEELGVRVEVSHVITHHCQIISIDLPSR